MTLSVNLIPIEKLQFNYTSNWLRIFKGKLAVKRRLSLMISGLLHQRSRSLLYCPLSEHCSYGFYSPEKIKVIYHLHWSVSDLYWFWDNWAKVSRTIFGQMNNCRPQKLTKTTAVVNIIMNSIGFRVTRLKV